MKSLKLRTIFLSSGGLLIRKNCKFILLLTRETVLRSHILGSDSHRNQAISNSTASLHQLQRNSFKRTLGPGESQYGKMKAIERRDTLVLRFPTSSVIW